MRFEVTKGWTKLLTRCCGFVNDLALWGNYEDSDWQSAKKSTGTYEIWSNKRLNKITNEVLQNFYISPWLVRLTEWRRIMCWTCITHAENRTIFKIWSEDRHGKILLNRYCYRGEDNINMDLTVVCCKDVDWIGLDWIRTGSYIDLLWWRLRIFGFHNNSEFHTMMNINNARMVVPRNLLAVIF
jgi:hypothetical protein